MANYTTNLNLKKPTDLENYDVGDQNGNMDLIDEYAGNTNEAIAAVQNGLAYIVGNTNTTGATLAVGQFVYVKGHSTIAEGLRKVTASISANGSITTSNTDACSEGGLNALNSNIVNKLDKETTVTVSVRTGISISITRQKVVKIGSLIAGSLEFKTTDTVGTDERSIFQLSQSPTSPGSGCLTKAVDSSVAGGVAVGNNGQIYINLKESASANTIFRLSFVVA